MTKVILKSIEKFFLNTLLRIIIVGVLLILVSNLLFFRDVLPIIVTSIILLTSCVCYIIRNRYPTASVIILTCIVLAVMCYQRIADPNNTATLSVVLIVGFVFSVMLKGRVMWSMHSIAFIILNSVFLASQQNIITAATAYSILYFVIAYATAVLKLSYDRMHKGLLNYNVELNKRADEIISQNMELLQMKDSLNVLNTDLERIVSERTEKIKIQNEILVKYNYSNAHYLRGPVARLLGLASIYKLDSSLEPKFIIDKMVHEAKEIDLVVKQINEVLESDYKMGEEDGDL